MFDDFCSLYQSVILDRSRNPRHRRRLESFDACAHGENPLCGDTVEVRLERDPSGRVARAGFEARGCAISIASADLMAELAAGHTGPEIRDLAENFYQMVRTGIVPSGDDALERLKPLAGVAEYPSRIKCATLPWTALVAALQSAKEERSE